MQRDFDDASHTSATIRSGLDSCKAKMVIASLGYTSDTVVGKLRHFGQRGRGLVGGEGNSPLINRGYFARVCAMDTILLNFLRRNKASNKACQVVEMGAGSSTLYWRYKLGELEGQECLSGCRPRVKWFEIDYDAVIQRKQEVMRKAGEELDEGGATIEFPAERAFLSADLCAAESFSEKLLSNSTSAVDPSLPTLFIFEAVLMYIEKGSSERLLADLCSSFSAATVAVYDAVPRQNSQFGSVMCQNLRRCGVDVSGMQATRTLEAQLERLRKAGFSAVDGMTMVSRRRRCWRAACNPLLPPASRVHHLLLLLLLLLRLRLR